MVNETFPLRHVGCNCPIIHGRRCAFSRAARYIGEKMVWGRKDAGGGFDFNRDASSRTVPAKDIDFFDVIKGLSPEITPRELSDRLNIFEIELFDKFPWALDLLEDEQNDLIIYAYGLKYGGRKMTDKDINDLCSELQAIYREWLLRCHATGLKVRATVTWRSEAEQNDAWAKGLSNAHANQSPHNCMGINGPASKAFDFGVFNDDASYVTDGTDDRYTQAGEIGEDLGLTWGGRWNHPDFDHLEIKNWKQA